MARHSARYALLSLAAGTALAVAGCATDATSGGDGGDGTGASGGNQSSAVNGGPSQPGTTPDGSAQDGSAPTDPAPTDPANTPDPAPPGDSAAPSGSGQETPWCATEDLSPSLRPLESAAGNRYSALALTNTSGAACRTQGWPGLQLADSAGRPIPTDAVRDRTRTPRQLTLEAGSSAWSRLHWTVVPGENDPSDGCPNPAQLRVTPPDQRTQQSTAWGQGTVCGGGQVDVMALAEGSGPDH